MAASSIVKEALAYLLLSCDKSSKVGRLPWFVEEEFQRLEEYNRRLKKQQTFTLATLPSNQAKNRYVDVLPCDAHCVTVKDCCTEESIYLNASRISNIFPEDDRVYIATQGPLKNCVKAFWHMVLQEEANVIVMLTRLVEKGMSKCDIYWPEQEGKVWNLGCIRLFLEKEVVVAEQSLVGRHIRICHSSDNRVEERLVYQMQYNGWPDHGIPCKESSFLYFLEQVEQYRVGKSLIVHCSAGIGRTGVFCALDILRRYLRSDSFLQKIRKVLEQDESKERVARLLINVVSETVEQLRKRRPGMIQTAQQFGFLWKCLSWNFDARCRISSES